MGCSSTKGLQSGKITNVGDPPNFLRPPQHNLLEDLPTIVKTKSKWPGSISFVFSL